MSAALRPSEPASENPLWAMLSAYDIGPSDTALPFTAKLARENGWSAVRAERVVLEYRRFLFLAATGTAATPSDPIDQAWHLHLTYTQDYWERLCPCVLGRPLHHLPSSGGPAALHRHFDQYAATLARYEAAFGTSPPADIWPPAHATLLDPARWRRIDTRTVILLPRARAALALGFVILAALGMLAP